MSATSNTPAAASETGTPKRKRASRKGQPRRFECPHDDCDKRYSRAEHLARHELNHSPKEVYRCDEVGCDNTFVRHDLYKRHKKKHEEATSPNRDVDVFPTGSGPLQTHADHHNHGSAAQPAPSPPTTCFNTVQTSYMRTAAEPYAHSTNHGFRDEASLISQPGQTATNGNVTTSQHPHHAAADSMGRLETAYGANSTWLPDQMTAGSGGDTYMGAIGDLQASDNFASWLFDSPGSQQQEFNLTNLPFLDFGLDYSPSELWNFEHNAASFGSVATPSLQTPSDTATDQLVDARRAQRAVRMSESRREHLASIIVGFLRKRRTPSIHVRAATESVLFIDERQTLPNLTTDVLEYLLKAYWRDVTKQMPILHQPTFDCDECEDLLLLALIMLGASQVVRSDSKGALTDYRDLADLLASHLRWEIFTEDDAQPPVQLWVAQALLLIEMYEKLYGTRRLHERAHIHHASTITLLRRGSPLVGHSGNDSPTSEYPTRCASPAGDAQPMRGSRESSAMRWWRRWVRNESMKRVVFAAFQMDALHAVMFGHDSNLFPYEIRLPLPCDEALWTANKPEEVQQLEATFSMHGIKPINFLDGLKKCLHGHEVPCHHHARLILVAGLYSVGWHISRREKHLQFLETVPSPSEHERWRQLLFNALGHWRRSFEEAITSSWPRHAGKTPCRDDLADPTVLFHLAHITMHTDIIDLQILAGYKRLMSRKITDRDHANVVQRMKTWINTVGARKAVHHSFRLLCETLVEMRPKQSYGARVMAYSCRDDSSMARPWTLYLAALTIWAYQYTLQLKGISTAQAGESLDPQDVDHAAAQYLAHFAAVETADRLLVVGSSRGCVALTMLLSEIFASSESELILEASKRLRECGKMLGSTTSP